MSKDDGNMRSFDTGATRDTTEGKLDFEGFLSPMVMKQYAKFMNMHRLQSDGKLRDSDNWQKGIPENVYMKSLYRHFFDAWVEHRGMTTKDGMMAALCGIMFNTMGYIHEMLKTCKIQDFDGDEPTDEMKERQEKVAEKKKDVGGTSYTPEEARKLQVDKFLSTLGDSAPELSAYGEMYKQCVYLGIDPDEFLIKPSVVVTDPANVEVCNCEMCTPNKGEYGEHFHKFRPSDPPEGFTAHSTAYQSSIFEEIVQPAASEEVVFQEEDCKTCVHVNILHTEYPCYKCSINQCNSNMGYTYWRPVV